MSAPAASAAATATTSPVFRSWLLWSALGAGAAYGFFRDASLKSAAAHKHAVETKDREIAHFNAARAAYAAHQAAEANKGKPATGIVSDPDSPDFDLEKLILHYAGETEAKH
ncbi:hypothetical protein AMAG_19468 [Allomyces macrogynus ATCC 38327]|uniref:ATP synthase F(0) complex subunit e, mitochondrial n=1 Tax=Allomyces macrogynus (strain ATCC 38327) TaxID=578462 RepID=A0A0L0SSW9_ALLM3|nr:hypothetical protein AMAG_19468 [Allomyces macrogynus ATCC 38327]|eukprot:KNE65444.1 hypothetical protein AMAG_19468 [Allomyces macrogynus ATCC 38327]